MNANFTQYKTLEQKDLQIIPSVYLETDNDITVITKPGMILKPNIVEVMTDISVQH